MVVLFVSTLFAGQFERQGPSKTQKMTAKKANRWMVTGLGRSLSACDRAGATGVEYGMGKRLSQSGVLHGPWLFFHKLCFKKKEMQILPICLLIT